MQLHSTIMKYFEITLMIVLVAGGQGLGQSHHEHKTHLNRMKRNRDSMVEDNLKVMLTKLIRDGNENIGVPVLEPFVKDKLTFVIKQDGMIETNVELKNLEIQGISNYTITKTTLDLVSKKLMVGIQFPKLYAKGLFNLTGNSSDEIQISASGEFNATLSELSFDTVIRIRIISNRPFINSIDLKIALNKLDFIATGLPGDESSSMILSKTISERAPQYINDHQAEITEPIIKEIRERGKTLLRGRTSQDFQKLLGNN